MEEKYKFIDLFAGIGGFHHAFHALGAECVFASEINTHARRTYEHNLKNLSPHLFASDKFNDDILKLTPENINETIPDFDVLCAGFPCQPFSQAGLKFGFQDLKEERGHMFFKLRDIIRIKNPRAIFLENVPHLRIHDGGKTFSRIKTILERELGYDLYCETVKACDFGLPQLRPRLFIIGFKRGPFNSIYGTFIPPKKIPLNRTMSDILGGDCNKEIGYTLRVGGRGSGLHDRRNWDTYLVNQVPIRLTPKMGLMMQGFPENFEFPVTDCQAMKQLGNSVAVCAVQAYGKAILERLEGS